MKSENEKYCQECGEIINVKAEICPKCGVRQNAGSSTGVNSRWLIALLLCWFLGVIGVHRFYTGHTGTGIIQLFTLGGLGVWAFIDFIRILVGDFKDADGNLISMKSV